MTKLLRRVAPAFLALLAAACAAGDSPPELAGGGPPGPPRGPGGAGPGPSCAPLFISPAGEPFRAAPDAPSCPLRTWFDGADADHDGALTRTEFRNDALRFFTVLDADGSGYIEARELHDYEHRIAPEILGGRGDGPGPGASRDAAPRLWLAAAQLGAGGGPGGYGGSAMGPSGGARGAGAPESDTARKWRLEGGGGLARFGLLGEPEPVAAADLNFDGRISREEFATRADQRFASLDEAETGRLTYADLERRMRPQGRGRGPGGGGPGAGGGRHGGRGGHGGGFGGPPQA